MKKEVQSYKPFKSSIWCKNERCKFNDNRRCRHEDDIIVFDESGTCTFRKKKEAK